MPHQQPTDPPRPAEHPSARSKAQQFLAQHLPPVPWQSTATPPPRPAAGAAPKPPAKRWRLEMLIGFGLVLLAMPHLRSAWQSTDADARPAAWSAPDATRPSATYLGQVASFTEQGEVLLHDGTRVGLLGVLFPTQDPRTLNYQLLAARNTQRSNQLPFFASRVAEVATRLAAGRSVEVVFDPSVPATRRMGQMAPLAYVWLLDEAGERDGMLNYQLIATGYGEPIPAGQYDYRTTFIDAGQRAWQQQAGLWSYGLFQTASAR